MTVKPNENTYEERKKKFELIRDKLGPSNPRSSENAERLLEYIQSGALPFKGSPQDAFDRDRLHRDYFLQIFFSIGDTILSEDLTKSEAQNRLEEARNASMPNNLPSDGSKGQWRAANKHKRKSYEWFLCEWDGGQVE